MDVDSCGFSLYALSSPAMKKGAIGFTRRELENGDATREGTGLDRSEHGNAQGSDLRTGAGNFFNGLTPNQDIVKV